MSAQSPSTGEQETKYLYWWLLTAIFFEYARPGAFLPVIEILKLNSLIPLGLLVATLFAKGLRPFRDILQDRYTKWLIAFIALILLSVPFAQVTLFSYNVFKLVLGYLFLFFMIARIATTADRLRGVFIALIMAHAFLIAMTPAIVTDPSVRNYIQGGTFLGDGNDFSLSLCILLPMAIDLTQSNKTRLFRLIAWSLLVLMLLAMIATQSRGATLAAAVMFGFLWLFSKKKMLTLVAIGGVAVLVGLYASDSYFERMSTITAYQGEGSAEGRITAWKAAMRMAVDHPLMGVGAGHFPVAFGTEYAPKGQGPMPWLTAHSMYFLILGELGLPGIVVLCSLVFGTMRQTMIARRRILVPGQGPPVTQRQEMARLLYLLTASAIGFAVAGAFLSVAYYPHIFVLGGILVAARSLANCLAPVHGQAVGSPRIGSR